MAAYADFAFYTTDYLGTAIAEADFPQLALRASAVIDQLTYNRAASETDEATIEKIQMANCAVAEEMQITVAQGGEDAIASESVGSHSVSYAENSTKRLTNDQRYYNAAYLYLSSTGLMFPGFMAGEYANQ